MYDAVKTRYVVIIFYLKPSSSKNDEVKHE